MENVYLKRNCENELFEAINIMQKRGKGNPIPSDELNDVHCQVVEAVLRKEYPDYAPAIAGVKRASGGVSIAFDDPTKAMLFKLAHG